MEKETATKVAARVTIDTSAAEQRLNELKNDPNLASYSEDDLKKEIVDLIKVRVGKLDHSASDVVANSMLE